MFDFSQPFSTPNNIRAGAAALYEVTQLDIRRGMNPLPSVQGNLDLLMQLDRRAMQRTNTVMWHSGRQAVICIGGLWDVAEFDAFLAGAVNPATIQGPGKLVNRMTWQYVDRIWDDVLELLDRPTDQLWLYGHSMGGTMCHVLAYLLSQRKAGMRFSIITFGTPRFANRAAVELFSRFTQYRITNVGDVVPMMPPTLTTFPVASAFWSGAAMWRFGQAIHTANHIMLSPDGTVQTGNAVVGFATPSQWLLQAVTDNMSRLGSAHLMSEYLIRTSRAFPAEAGNAPPLPANIAILPNRLHGETIRLQEAERAVGNLRVEVDRPFDLPAEVMRTHSRVRVRKEFGGYVVKLDGQVVYVASNKADARGWARSLRVFMRQYLQRPGRVSFNTDVLALIRGERRAGQVGGIAGGIGAQG